MTDILDRLRAAARNPTPSVNVCAEGAAEIQKLRDALKPFAEARTPEGYFGPAPDEYAYRRARLALGLQVPER
jgi:hypothetical protein